MMAQEPGRAGKLFYTTGEACRRLNIPQHTLRYWEKRLGLSFMRTKGGRRLYRREDMELLARVIKYMSEGYSLAGTRRIIKGMSQLELPLDSSAGPLKKAVRRVRRELAEILDSLK